MNDKDLDKLFKKQLEHHQVAPQKAVWQNIESHLDNQKTTPLRRINWMLYAATFIGCLGLLTLAYYMTQRTSEVGNPYLAHRDTVILKNHSVQKPYMAEGSVQPLSKENVNPRTEQTNKQLASSVKTIKPQKSYRKDRETDIQQKHELTLVPLELSRIQTLNTRLMDTADSLPIVYAISIPPIAPLIDNPEVEESMLASSKTSEGLVPEILNKISDALVPTDKPSLQFSQDEEGFLRFDIVNSFVKNRNKKRR